MKSLQSSLSFTIISITLIFMGCSGKTTTVASALNVAPSSCIIGKWSNSYLPLQLKMSDEFPSVELDGNGLNNIEQMAKKWNDASTRTLITVPFPGSTATHGYTTTAAFRDSEIGIYKSTTWFPGVSSSALAITQFYGVVSSNSGLGQYIDLTHADIIVNFRDYRDSFTMTNNPAKDYDLPTVIIHEMGHLLGLCHETKRTSIMAPYYLTTQRYLQAFDADIIKDLYVDGVITNYSASAKAANTNELQTPEGTEVKGIIELRSDGQCVHYIEGKEIYRHLVDLKTRPQNQLTERIKNLNLSSITSK